MRIGFGVLLVSVVALGLGSGAGLAAYQSSELASRSPSATQAASAAAATGQVATQARSDQAGQMQWGGTPVAGVVDSVGAKEFSVKTEGSATPVKVRLDDQTVIRKQVSGTVGDIKQGERISVAGATDSDGNVAANTVQLVGAEAASAFTMAQAQARGQAGQQARATGAGGQAGQQAGAMGGGGRSPGSMGIVMGTVKEIAGSIVSVARSGGSAAEETVVKVTLKEQTRITKTVAGEVADLVVGASVSVAGSRGADGEIAASSVQILPAATAGPPSSQ